MSNPTTPFNWQMPTNTDLVTDLPADFEVFGQAVATSMADLLGGTTGQILSKASNTNMDFTWIANDQGDITGVTATSPLTGGGTSGAITVGIQSASTSQSGAVQLSDSTSTTSSVLAATPTAVKAAYDLANTANTAAGTAQTTANAAIPKSTVTTAGDVIYATGSSAVTRLGIGSTGQVLTVASGVPSWATPTAGGGKILQVVQGTTTTATTIATTTMTDTGITATITPTSATSKILVMISAQFDASRSTGNIAVGAKILRGATTIQDFGTYGFAQINATGSSATEITIIKAQSYLDSPATTSATTYKLQAAPNTTANSASAIFQIGSFPSSIILMEVGA
jgi:hypothetical protein